MGAALWGTLPDVSVPFMGPWDTLPEGRHSLLGDPAFELRMLREGFRHDPRVRLAGATAATPAPTPFRYTGPVDVPLEPATLERMIKKVTDDRLGALIVTFRDERTARLDSTEAL